MILDLMMPKLNGVDVLKYIRSTPELKKTPVIILSNAHMTSLAQEAAAILDLVDEFFSEPAAAAL